MQQKHSKRSVAIFLVSAVVMQLLLFLLCIMIYETAVAAFGIANPELEVLALLLSLTFISASFLVTVADNAATRAYYRFTGAWFAFVAPLCAASAAFVVIEDVFPLWGWIITPATAGVIVFGAAAAIGFYGIWNGLRVRVTRVSVVLPGLPETWQGRRGVFFSDVHLGPLRGAGLARQIVRRVQEQDPSFIIIGGDLFDGTKCDAEKCIAPLAALRAPDGVYFVSGNHEYIRESDRFFNAIRNAGIRILKNEKITIDGVKLAGVDWRDTHHAKDFAAVLRSFADDGNGPSILVRHVPSDLSVAEEAGFSFQLSGHTHQGQFWPLSLATKRFYGGFDYGLRRFGNMAVYTSSGVGTWLSPFRIGTRAEVVVMEFTGGAVAVPAPVDKKP